tara:strand:+ start:557 stop:742 length:186 start_codon:yes stop_codon:yes gene_type:complete
MIISKKIKCLKGVLRIVRAYAAKVEIIAESMTVPIETIALLVNAELTVPLELVGSKFQILS